MSIFDLLIEPSRFDCALPVEMDALTETGTLLEAALLSASLDPTTGDARLLFDCRGALQLRNGNTAVVVVKNVSEFRWHASPRRGSTWHAVMSWIPSPHPAGLAITAGLTPDADLQIVGLAGEFYVGNILGGDKPPPDFTSSTPAEIRRGLASWTSEIDVVGASFR
ncbi:hypothetical protein [uncultured Friedmanniella sp.]|uniref:hypothetical protein n=1 Tax=uncultured Friedmanniella sp. TaxID=335381 RepID=UPI0035CA2CD5